MINPFRVTVYDVAFQRRGWIGNPLSLTVNPRHNLPSTATFTLDSDHPRIGDLIADGARVVIEYHGEHVISGPIRATSGSGPTAVGAITFTVEDDIRLLARILGWPNPAGTIMQQGDIDAFDEMTGPAESVLKHFVSVNATRLGLPVTVAPDLGRGATITVKMRMTPLTDNLYPALDLAGIGVTVRQDGAGLVVDAYTPTVRSQILSEASGVLLDWSWARTAPSATRVIMGGPGEGVERDFAIVTDAARETAFGDVIEIFRDARDVVDPGDLVIQGDEVIADTAAKAGLSLTLAETDYWRYGSSVRVGDKVTAQIAPGVTVTDVLREATLAWDGSGGLVVTPQIGDRTDDPDLTLARTVAALARGLRNINAGR